MTNLNPLSLLADVIPATARKYVYALVATALFVYSLWEVAGGDIKAFLIALGTALVTALAAANTPASKAEVADAAVEMIEDVEADIDRGEDLSYPDERGQVS